MTRMGGCASNAAAKTRVESEPLHTRPQAEEKLKFSARRLVECFRLLWLPVFCALTGMPQAHAQDAAALKARNAALRVQLASNQFHRPLYLESIETPGNLRGEIYAPIERPYAEVGPALQRMDQWCDILILHLNVKSCRASTPTAGDTLSLRIGRKADRPLAEAYPFELFYKVVAGEPDYLQAVLNAEKGPLGTRRYRVVLEVVKLDVGRSFLHLSYSYDYGKAARLAMQSYLAMFGRAKMGFSIVGSKADGQPVHIGGMRGVIERNTMRYYLAFESYLGSLSVPAQEQLEKRLNDWYTGVERYPVQLHELERGEYIAMKRKEVQRQLALRSAVTAK